MKKIMKLIAVTFILLNGYFVHAQFSTGSRVGFQFSTVSTDEMLDEVLPDLKFIRSLSYAVTAQYEFNDFALYSEVAISKKGFAIKERYIPEIYGYTVPVGFDIKSKVRYVEIPLLAKYSVGGEKVKFYMMAGPQFGYALDGTVSVTPRIFTSFYSFKTKFDLDAINYNRFEISAVGGIGVTFGLGKNNRSSLNIDTRYIYGFNDNLEVPLIDAKIQNRSLGVNIGYQYNF